VGTVAGRTDGELLEMFARRGGEAAELAFAALVERHGPAVFRACRAVLGDRQDAEDAFQATFLVLARKAGGLSRPGALTGWLHGVALRVAARARAARGRRARHERRRATATPEATAAAPPDDLAAALHEELAQLPQRYRAAVLLCDLQDRSHAEAARELGCAPGTVGSRLSRGRRRLQARLARRGLAPAAVVAALAAEADAGAGPPPALAEATAGAAVRFAAGGAASAGAVPAAAAALAKGVLTTMLISKLKGATAAVVAAGLIAVGGGVLAQSGKGPGPDGPPPGDRLGDVERKLDRLLKLFEGGEGPPRARWSIRDEPYGSATAQPKRPDAPAAGTPTAPTHIMQPPGGGLNTPLAGQPGQAVNTFAASAEVQDRVSRLEQRLDQLERRLRRLEGGGPPRDDDVPKAK
jgi:RNA polymerase sigma factor (sigma-70 family)